MMTATPGTTMRVFAAALAGRVIGFPPGRVSRPPVTLVCAVTALVFRWNEHDEDTPEARSECCPGSTTDGAVTFDAALTAPAESVMMPVCRIPAVSALGRMTGDPPE